MRDRFKFHNSISEAAGRITGSIIFAALICICVSACSKETGPPVSVSAPAESEQAAAQRADLPNAQWLQQSDLPEGEGKALVQGLCVACHQTTMITRSTGYSQDEWRYLVSKMIELSEPTQSQVVEYLAQNFPPSSGREPVLISGDTQIAFQEWFAPTLGQRVRDPLMDADGNIWWVGTWRDVIGRVNPKNGVLTEYKLRDGAGPHGISPDADGNIWYTGNGDGTMGKIDRSTGEITVFPMPDRELDPHTAVFVPDGSVWFTMERHNKLARLDPATGAVEVLDTPTEQSHPYGIRADSQGMLWVAYKGAYKLARLNPETREITEYSTPSAGKYPDLPYYIRRLAISSDDMIWYTDSGRGELGRFNPKTGEFKQWPSPSGPNSHPYAIEVVNDIVWYNESNQRPDALVRFDPRTESFQSWAVPSGFGVVRNMNPTPNGNLLIHQSSTNTVGLVTIGDADHGS